MELRQLRTFEALVAHRTVAAAAGVLGLAPAAVSEQLRTLERSLGTALLARSARGLTPTPAGHRLLPWARRLLDQAEQARRAVTGARAVLRLGAAPATVAAGHASRVLARLAERHPDLKVSLHTGAARDGLLHGVAAGSLDAALVLDAPGPLGALGFTPPPVQLAHQDLAEVPLALVTAPEPASSGDTAPSPAGRRLLVNTPACSFRLAGDRLFGPGVERLRTGGVTATRACAERGLGMALLPESAVHEQLAAGTLRRLELADPVPPLLLRLVWRADRDPAPAVHAVLHAATTPPG
ncbi:LysR family transcriptional regulator [Kitasatospora sp. NPDC056327]|uniref:LysR family transcriptional regulator n=1 Tax=Kitasatospora sp. NPDC056327 TaxID=3345785 RepID=UPI0035D872B4